MMIGRGRWVRGLFACVVLAACASDDGPIAIELGSSEAEVTRAFDVAGVRTVRLVTDGPILVEAWADRGEVVGMPPAQRDAGLSRSWLAPLLVDGEREIEIAGEGEVTLSVWARGALPPPPTRARSAAWLDPSLLDDPRTVSFAGVMAAMADDGHGGLLLDRWFRAFAAGPGAGRATFAQFLDEVVAEQGSDPRAWELSLLPFETTGIHNRLDLAGPSDCGELRVSFASTHATFSPLHVIVLFRQVAQADDATPDGTVHCRGTARRWARLAGLDDAAFATAARELLAASLTHERFLLAETVELTLSPWQWRQWIPDGAGGLANPPLFQTLDVARVNAPGALRDAFLAEVAANAEVIAARTWIVPGAYRSPIAEVQPSEVAPLVDLSPLADALASYPELPRALGVIGCPRCHTEDADFVQTAADRTPSPFYDRELDARTARIDALARGGWPAPVTFGPLSKP